MKLRVLFTDFTIWEDDSGVITQSIPNKEWLICYAFFPRHTDDNIYKHQIAGWDRYYVRTVAGQNYIEFANWNLPFNNNTRTDVWELRGVSQEVKRSAVRIGELPTPFIFVGGNVSDPQWEEAMTIAAQWDQEN